MRRASSEGQQYKAEGNQYEASHEAEACSCWADRDLPQQDERSAQNGRQQDPTQNVVLVPTVVKERHDGISGKDRGYREHHDLDRADRGTVVGAEENRDDERRQQYAESRGKYPYTRHCPEDLPLRPLGAMVCSEQGKKCY